MENEKQSLELTPAEMQLLTIASNVANTGYTPENKGVLEVRERNILTYTPMNIRNIYVELLELFQVNSVCNPTCNLLSDTSGSNLNS